VITNAKIERKKTEIARIEMTLAETKGKLREKKQELIKLENDEIVAMFRSELLTEDGYAALMRSRREAEYDDEDDSPNERTPKTKIKEESTDALSEN
jgi:hypothetical protein